MTPPHEPRVVIGYRIVRTWNGHREWMYRTESDLKHSQVAWTRNVVYAETFSTEDEEFDLARMVRSARRHSPRTKVRAVTVFLSVRKKSLQTSLDELRAGASGRVGRR